MKKIALSLLSLLLCITFALSLLACQPSPTDTTSVSTAPSGATRTGIWENATYVTDTELGTGAKEIRVIVSGEGQWITFTIHTDAANLGDALFGLGLINDASFFDTANGITATWSVNEAWWNVLDANDVPTSGVNVTSISGGELFKIVYTLGF